MEYNAQQQRERNICAMIVDEMNKFENSIGGPYAPDMPPSVIALKASAVIAKQKALIAVATAGGDKDAVPDHLADFFVHMLCPPTRFKLLDPKPEPKTLAKCISEILSAGFQIRDGEAGVLKTSSHPT